MVRISPLEIPSEQPNDCAMVGNYIVRYWCCRTISSARFWKARSLAGARSAAQDVPDANQLLPTTGSAPGLLFQEGAQQVCDARFLADDRFIMLRGGLALGHLCKLCGQHTHGGVSTDVGSFLRRNCHPARRVPAQLPSHFFAPPLEVSSVAGDAHVRINLQMRPSFVSLCFYSGNCCCSVEQAALSSRISHRSRSRRRSDRTAAFRAIANTGPSNLRPANRTAPSCRSCAVWDTGQCRRDRAK